MIRQLTGNFVWHDASHILIDVNGVGYIVYATADVMSNIPNIGEKLKVFTYLHVREDILELYGFATMEELQLFENFISVSGIGPKTAIGIFSIGSRDRIVSAILAGDAAFFSAVPRLGKKNAQKLIIELKSKVGALEDINLSASMANADTEVLNALKAFGFSPGEINEALRNIAVDGKSVSEKIRLALKYLGK